MKNRMIKCIPNVMKIKEGAIHLACNCVQTTSSECKKQVWAIKFKLLRAYTYITQNNCLFIKWWHCKLKWENLSRLVGVVALLEKWFKIPHKDYQPSSPMFFTHQITLLSDSAIFIVKTKFKHCAWHMLLRRHFCLMTSS
jgi:hypothetical protein